MILAKDKNDEEALVWFLKSVNAFPMNWGCWQEIGGLISRIEDVGCLFIVTRSAEDHADAC
jgi:anaphase-promoting complex subunit 8